MAYPFRPLLEHGARIVMRVSPRSVAGLLFACRRIRARPKVGQGIAASLRAIQAKA
jgi:hypothetical protein